MVRRCCLADRTFWRARLLDVGARHGGRLIFRTPIEEARSIAALLLLDVEIHRAGTAAQMAAIDRAAELGQVAARCPVIVENVAGERGELVLGGLRPIERGVGYRSQLVFGVEVDGG